MHDTSYDNTSNKMLTHSLQGALMQIRSRSIYWYFMTKTWVSNQNQFQSNLRHQKSSLFSVYSRTTNVYKVKEGRSQWKPVRIKGSHSHRKAPAKTKCKDHRQGNKIQLSLKILCDQWESSIHMCWLPIGQYLWAQRETKLPNWVVDHKAKFLQLQKMTLFACNVDDC